MKRNNLLRQTDKCECGLSNFDFISGDEMTWPRQNKESDIQERKIISFLIKFYSSFNFVSNID